MDRLYRELENYKKENIYPFHMPGHKRNSLSVDGDFPFDRDITEIDGFDNLHHAEGILKEAQEAISRLYGTKESFYSVNGSTAALLASVSASVNRGGRILMARNCHKAAYHALYLRDLRPVYVYPGIMPGVSVNGGIIPSDLEKILKKNEGIEAVLVTSPTYDGVVSDIRKIAETVHKYGIPLIVDEAHGAHFKFSGYFPDSAVDLGADLVVQSLHKTLPSMTQTAVLHRCSDRVDREKLLRFLGIYQTSSPSYILMASIDACADKISRDGEEMFQRFAADLEETREQLAECRNIRLISPEISGRTGVFAFDRSKILLSTAGTALTGKELAGILLQEHRLQMEMEAPDYVLALTSAADTGEGLRRLCSAVESVDKKVPGRGSRPEGPDIHPEEPLQLLPPSQAMDAPFQTCSLEECAGKISSEFVYLYPPGIPILVPGEQITGHLVQNMRRYMEQGFRLQGLCDYTGETIRVVEES